MRSNFTQGFQKTAGWADYTVKPLAKAVGAVGKLAVKAGGGGLNTFLSTLQGIGDFSAANKKMQMAGAR